MIEGMNNKLPTIKEIARRLNVSISTVSRALADNPRIGLGTRAKVQKLAKELGYEPNSQAILFKQKKTHIIGVVMPFIREEFFSEAISGIETVALQYDYTILFGQSYDDVEQEIKVVDAMRKQRVDGLLISLSKQTNKYEHLQALEKFEIPVVYFDRVPPFPHAHKVFCNLYKGTIELVGWLFNQGRRRIAFINGPDKIIASKERLNGYIEGIAKQKLKVDMQLVEKTDLTKDSTQAAINKLLSLKNPPNAIITFNDYVHMDAVQYAERQMIKINEDIVFVSYANLPITSYTAYPPLASLEQYPYRQGERAIQILINLLSVKDESKNTKPEFQHEEMPSTLILNQFHRG